MRIRTFILSGLCLLAVPPVMAQSTDAGCACNRSATGRVIPGPVISTQARYGAESMIVGHPIDRSPLQIVIPERVLNRLLTEETSDAGPIRDVIAKADVVGEQSTVGQVHVDCRPSAHRGEIHLVMQGIVSSDTIGWTPQAAVSTVGRHQVYAVKPVMFDGFQVTTKRPRIWVDVQNQNISARTPYDGIPILNWIAQSTVRSETRRKQPQIDAETAESVAARLGPKFNRDADRRLAKLNRTWRDEWMAKYNELWPKTFAIRTTDSELQLSATWPDAPELTATELSSVHSIINQDEITIRVHESVMNSALNRLPIAGQAFSEKQLRDAVNGFIANIGGRVMPKKSDEDDETQIELKPGMMPMIRMAKATPARVKIENGSLRLIVKAGIEVAGQTILAEDEISMPLTLTDMRSAWQIDPGTLSFAKSDDGAALVGMMNTIVRKQLAASIPSTTYQKVLAVNDPEIPLDSMRMTKMEATTGWLTMSFAAEPRGQRIIREYEMPNDSVPNEFVPSGEVIQPRLQPLPEEALPANGPTARRPATGRVTVRAARVPTRNPEPIQEGWATFPPRRTRTSSGFWE